MKKILLITIIIIFQILHAFSQPITVGLLTPQDSLLIKSLLENSCTTVSDIIYTGDGFSFGHFVSNGNFEMTDGLILSTGKALDAAGPNNSGSTSYNSAGTDGNSLLLSIFSVNNFDVALLEYNLISNTDYYSIQFVYGSEEYPFVWNSFIDPAGIFISGPNPLGGYYDNENIAVLPGTSIPLTVANINSSTNNQYFTNNGDGVTPNNEPLDYDGFTIPINNTIDIIPGEIYNVKIVIGDCGDSNYDSGLLFRSISIIPETMPYHFEMESLYGNGLQLFEGHNATFKIIRNDSSTIAQNLTINLGFAGSATPGIDYSLLPSTVYLPAGQMDISLPITLFIDTIAESGEEIIIYDQLDCSANSPLLSIPIYDDYFFDAGFYSDTLLLCGTGGIIETYCNSQNSLVSYLWSSGETTSSIYFPDTIAMIDTRTISIAHSDGFQITDTIVIINSGFLSTIVSEVSSPCELATLELSVSGGYQPYSYLWSNNETTQTISSVWPGEMNVTVTDYYGCSSYQQVEVITQPSVNIQLAINSLCTDTFGNITSIASYGNPPYTYSWSTGDTTNSISSVAPGDYFITVTDSLGCEVTDSIIGFNPTIFTPELNYSSLGCNPWSAELIISDGTPPYSIHWSDNTLDTLGFSIGWPGSYSVTVSDAMNCYYTDTFEFIVDSTIYFTSQFNIYNNPCGPVYNFAKIIPDPISGNYSYMWSNGQTSDSIINVPSGLYYVTIINSYSCIEVKSVSLSNNLLNVTEEIENVTDCILNNNGMIKLIAAGGLPPYQYLWSQGSTTDIISNLFTGQYDYTVIDACNSEITGSITIYISPPAFNLTYSVVDPFCSNGNGVISLTDMNNDMYYSWLYDTSWNMLQSSVTGYFDSLYVGNYFIIVSDTFNCGFDTINIDLNEPLISVNAYSNLNSVACQGDSVFVFAEIQGINTSDLNYLVDIIPFNYEDTGGISVSQVIDDKYYGPFPTGFDFSFFGEDVTQFYIGSNGWISFSQLSSPVYDPWVFNAIPNTDPTKPRNVIMAAYRDWNMGLGGSITYSTSGTAPYRKLIVNWISAPLYSCTNLIGDFQIVLYETSNIIDVNLSHVPVCPTWNSGNGISGIQNAAGTIAYFLDGMNFTPWEADNLSIRYSPDVCSWYDPQFNYITSGNYTNINVTSSGYYYAKINSCTDVFDSIYIDIQSNITGFDLGSDVTICYGDSIGVNQGNNFNYQWNTLSDSGYISIIQSGLYSLTISDSICSISDEVNITVEEINIAPDYSESICNSGITIVNFDTIFSYLWQDGTTTPSIEITSSGIYYLTVSSDLCSYPKYFDLVMAEYPVFQADTIIGFCGEQTTVYAGDALNYVWSNGYIGSVLIINTAGIYSVTMSNGPCITQATTTVSFLPVPDVSLENDTTICEGASLTLNAGSFAEYIWSNGSTSQTLTISTPDIYWVEVANSSGCTDIDSIEINMIYNAVSAFDFDEAFGTSQFINTSQNAVDYIWDFGDGSPLSTEINPTHTYPSLPLNEWYTTTLIASNMCGSDTSNFELIIFDIDGTDVNNDIRVFPNPTSGKFSIVGDNGGINEITLQNSLGQVIFNKFVSNNPTEFDIEFLPDGIYFLSLKKLNSTLIYKIIKL